jgi:hypothetical protein
MSGSNIKATINTPIQDTGITELEKLMLREHGFEYLEDDGYCYFYAQQGVHNPIKRYPGIDSDDILEALSVPENRGYFNSKQEMSNTHYQTIFQNIIRRNDDLSAIAIEGIRICGAEHGYSDTQPGQFSGFVELITEDNVLERNTRQLLHEAYENIGCAPLLIKTDTRDQGDDFVMADDGRSVRIGIKGTQIYIVPSDDELTVLAYPKGQKIDDPAGIICIALEDDISESCNAM